MDVAWVVAVAIALGADAFSMSLAIGLSGIRWRKMLHLSLVVAVFHVIMPLGGILLGQTLGAVIGQFAGSVGALVLLVLGVRILYKVYRPSREQHPLSKAREAFFSNKLLSSQSLKGFSIYLLAASVSLDALSVGFSLGTIRANVMVTVLIIGLIAGLMTASGLILGRVMGTRLGERAEVLGGLALFLIGIKLFFH